MIDVPVLRITLTGLERTLLNCIDEQAADLRAAVQFGIQKAIPTLHLKVASACENALSVAFEDAMKEAANAYWQSGPGAKIIEQEIKKMMGKPQPKE